MSNRPELFVIYGDEQAMLCRRCGMKTHNKSDVRYRYCGRCHMFLDPATDPLIMWTVFDHPDDFPDSFVARKSAMVDGQSLMTAHVLISPSIDDLREMLARQGLVSLMRHPDDDPKIVEVWL